MTPDVRRYDRSERRVWRLALLTVALYAATGVLVAFTFYHQGRVLDEHCSDWGWTYCVRWGQPLGAPPIPRYHIDMERAQ